LRGGERSTGTEGTAEDGEADQNETCPSRHCGSLPSARRTFDGAQCQQKPVTS
jgi:hypothetical protein